MSNFLAYVPDEPECYVDQDCPRQMSCIDRHCENLCQTRNPCVGDLECSVEDSLDGRRTVACSCPVGFVAIGANHCEQGSPFVSKVLAVFLMHDLFIVEVHPQCTSHEQCGDPQICHQGSCQHACRFQTCGVNAVCTAQYHVARCECRQGFFGDNPNVGCQTSKCMMFLLLNFFAWWPLSFVEHPSTEAVTVGCENDGDCPDYAACENTHCINPCAIRDPCAPLATCRVINHAPVCTCPDGYIGSPEIECKPRKYNMQKNPSLIL